MRRRRGSIIAVAAILAVTSGFFLLVVCNPREWRVRGLLRVEPKSDERYDPFLFQKTIQSASNFVSRPEVSEAISKASKRERSKVRFGGAGPIRNTSLISVTYVGSDSNAVWCSASNACLMLQSFYATNQPGLVVDHVATQDWPPSPLWGRMLDGIERLFRH